MQGWVTAKLVPVAVGLLALMLTVLATWTLDSAAREQHVRQQESRALEQLGLVRARIESELNSSVYLTHGLAAYVSAHPALDGGDIEHLVDELLRRSEHVSHIALAPDNVIRYIRPREGNEAAIGLDYAQEPEQWPAVELAMTRRALVIAGPVDLVQGGRALATREPVYVRDGDNGRYWGLVTSVIELEPLMRSAGVLDSGNPGALALRDRDSGTMIAGNQALFEADAPMLTIQLPGITWELAGKPATTGGAVPHQPWLALGYLFALVAGGMSWRLAGQAMQIRGSERRYRHLIEGLPDGVCITENGRFRFINPRLAEMLGVGTTALAGRDVADVVHEEDRADVASVLERGETDKPGAEREVRLLRIDGGTLHTRLNARPTAWESRPAALITVTDITERKQLEAALLQSRDRLTALMQALPDVAFLVDADGRYMDVFGGRDTSIYGNARALLGRTMREVLPEPLAGRCLETIGTALATGKLQTLVHPLPGAGEGETDGEPSWVEARVVALGQAASERQAVLWLALDVTAQKRTELRLRQREAAFQALVENSPDVISRMDRELRYLYISPSVERYSGIPPASHIGRTSREVGVPMELVEAWEAQFRRTFAGEGPQSLEFNFTAPDGALQYFESRAIPEYGPDGEVETVLVIDREITAQKRNEDQLRLAASVFHNTTEAMLVADAYRRVIRCNPAFVRLTGFASDEAAGRPVDFLRSDDSGIRPGDDSWAAVAHNGYWEGEVIARRRDAEAFPAWLTINAIRDRDQEITNYLLVLQDISHRKRQEEQLRHEATHDALTGLPNRTLLLDRLRVALAQVRRSRESLALLFVDLDNFKPINDDLGHRVGDHVLRILGERMREAVREADTVARLGGDEFVILLTPPTPLPAVDSIARDLLRRLPAAITLHGGECTVSASIGIARFPEDGDTPDTLINAADAAMYEAKALGRARYQYRTPPAVEPSHVRD